MVMLDRSIPEKDAWQGWRKSTLSRVSRPVAFILMRDSRQSTPAVAEALAQAERGPTADQVPWLLADRLKAARLAAGLSQEALAKAVNEHGLTWRQTTVAKTEKGDRPVLFVEAVILARVLGLSVEDFASNSGPLEQLSDKIRTDWQQVRVDVIQAEARLSYARDRRASIEVSAALLEAVLNYKREQDSGPLLDSIQAFVDRYGVEALRAPEEVFRALGLDDAVLRDIDGQALLDAGEAGTAEIAIMSQQQLAENYTGEHLKNAYAFLEGKAVDPEFIRYMRDGAAWRRTVALLLTSLIIESDVVRDNF
ncbi:helix-turn-helix transcriptional regulator [Streptomyces zaomyceticus]|uniref:helix-turn-helix transcriptional regulator n=1 Tax=Streptomyces zaomyceticus TaxID=68286 RepID=UPI00341B24E1